MFDKTPLINVFFFLVWETSSGKSEEFCVTFTTLRSTFATLVHFFFYWTVLNGGIHLVAAAAAAAAVGNIKEPPNQTGRDQATTKINRFS